MDKVCFVAGEIKLYENMKVKQFFKFSKILEHNYEESFFSNLIKLFI